MSNGEKSSIHINQIENKAIRCTSGHISYINRNDFLDYEKRNSILIIYKNKNNNNNNTNNINNYW